MFGLPFCRLLSYFKSSTLPIWYLSKSILEHSILINRGLCIKVPCLLLQVGELQYHSWLDHNVLIGSECIVSGLYGMKFLPHYSKNHIVAKISIDIACPQLIFSCLFSKTLFTLTLHIYTSFIAFTLSLKARMSSQSDTVHQRTPSSLLHGTLFMCRNKGLIGY